MLVAAPGLLSEPSIPDLPGLDGFEGRSFHTARWEHDHDLTGRDVAVVGTGATAIQVVPRIKDQVRKVTVFQRTPPWVIFSLDRSVTKLAHWLYPRVPGVQRATRTAMWAALEPIALGMTRWPALLKGHEMASRTMIRTQVRDPELRERLTPDYAFGCKRMLLSNEWYPALDSPNVELVSQGVEEVRERSLVAADGSEHAADTIVFATGFTPTDPPIARRLRGRDGRTLSETWQGSPQSYLATTVAGFPNLFLLYGPNSNLGHNSIVYMLESQMNYVMGALRAMRERGAPRAGGPARGAGRVQRGDAEPLGPLGVGRRRLRQLVPRRARAGLDHVAGLHLRVPKAHPRLRPRLLRRAARGLQHAGGHPGGVVEHRHVTDSA